METVLQKFPLRQEKSREDRMFNIAVIVLALGKLGLTSESSKEQANTFLGTARVRREIRAQLKLPELSGEPHLGDLRAHGDSLGGHGLKLETVKQNGKRYIGLTVGNVGKCQAFLINPCGDKRVFID